MIDDPIVHKLTSLHLQKVKLINIESKARGPGPRLEYASQGRIEQGSNHIG